VSRAGSRSVVRTHTSHASERACRYRIQTREHLFKVCPEWKAQQKILWAEVLKETGVAEDPRPPRRREIPLCHRCGKAGAG